MYLFSFFLVSARLPAWVRDPGAQAGDHRLAWTWKLPRLSFATFMGSKRHREAGEMPNGANPTHESLIRFRKGPALNAGVRVSPTCRFGNLQPSQTEATVTCMRPVRVTTLSF